MATFALNSPVVPFAHSPLPAFTPFPATFLRDCSLQNEALACRLDGVLHALYIVAAILAIVLVLCVVVSVEVCRRRKVNRSTVL